MRVVFSWVLALAIPVQGYAASTMLACAGGHHYPPTAAAMAQEGHAHDHEMAGHDAHENDHGAMTATPSDEHGSGFGPSSCSACAACCSLLALPSAAPVVAEPERLAGHGAPPAFTAPAFVTDGPERPPRASHA